MTSKTVVTILSSPSAEGGHELRVKRFRKCQSPLTTIGPRRSDGPLTAHIPDRVALVDGFSECILCFNESDAFKAAGNLAQERAAIELIEIDEPFDYAGRNGRKSGSIIKATIRNPRVGRNNMGQFVLEMELEGDLTTGFCIGFPPKSGMCAELIDRFLDVTDVNYLAQLEGQQVFYETQKLLVTAIGRGQEWIDLPEMIARYTA